MWQDREGLFKGTLYATQENDLKNHFTPVSAKKTKYSGPWISSDLCFLITFVSSFFYCLNSNPNVKARFSVQIACKSSSYGVYLILTVWPAYFKTTTFLPYQHCLDLNSKYPIVLSL